MAGDVQRELVSSGGPVKSGQGGLAQHTMGLAMCRLAIVFSYCLPRTRIK